MLLVPLFDLFGFVCFLFLLVSRKGCSWGLWHSMNFKFTCFRINVTPLDLHSASSARICLSVNIFFLIDVFCKINKPLNLQSDSSVNFRGLSNLNIFHNNLN